jgi:hypothetical protein
MIVTSESRIRTMANNIRQVFMNGPSRSTSRMVPPCNASVEVRTLCFARTGTRVPHALTILYTASLHLDSLGRFSTASVSHGAPSFVGYHPIATLELGLVGVVAAG